MVTSPMMTRPLTSSPEAPPHLRWAQLLPLHGLSGPSHVVAVAVALLSIAVSFVH